MCLCTGSDGPGDGRCGATATLLGRPTGHGLVLSNGAEDIVLVDSNGANRTPLVSSPAHEGGSRIGRRGPAPVRPG